jgi:hypothetical protein
MIKSKLLAAFLLLTSCFMQAQTVTSFEGIAASQLGRPEHDVDPNGAIGTKQYMEWTNVAFQAYDKVTLAPLWPTPQVGNSPWKENGITGCNIAGDGVILFDRLASRWVVAGHNSPGAPGPYYYCIAVSNTDDLASTTLAWFAYKFPLDPVLGTNAEGHLFFPDWPKLGTWADAYYLSFDAMDIDQSFRIVGSAFCALDRTNMLTGSTANPMQCFTDPSPFPAKGAPFLGHSPIPADVEGTTPPPNSRHEFFVSIQNPPRNGKSTTSTSLNLWNFHVDWADPSLSTFTHSSLAVTAYAPGCYTTALPTNTVCAPEPAVRPNGSHYHIDSVGDRMMPRLAYRNFGSYQSWLISHTVRVGTGASMQTGVRWYELRGNGTPKVYQIGTVSPDKTLYRFMPSIAQDHVGNAAVGYSTSSTLLHPGLAASSWSLKQAFKPAEVGLHSGGGDEENTADWGDYSSMTVDPVDDCTFWYVNQYFQEDETGSSYNWDTRIAKFALSSCHEGVKAAKK